MKIQILAVLILLTLTTSQAQNNNESRIFGGTKKADFAETLIQLNNDGTGKYLCWAGEHGWAWRESFEFEWTIKNDSIIVRLEGDYNDSFMGLLKKDKIVPKQTGQFSMRNKYFLITKEKQKALEKFKEDL